MWYGYVGPKLGGVTRDWSFVKNTIMKVPYATYRAYRLEEEAWNFVRSRKNKYILHSINKYGDIFDSLYVTLEYFITSSGLYANLDTSKLGYVRLGTTAKDVTIKYKADLILIHVPMSNISSTSLESHAVCIVELLSIIGGLIDIEIILQDFSVYYMLTHYTGDRYIYRKIKNVIDRRAGNIAYTIKSKYMFRKEDLCYENLI